MRIGLLLAFTAATGLAALDHAEARHLLMRTGFGAHPDKIAELESLTREEAVDQLFDAFVDYDEDDVMIKKAFADYLAEKAVIQLPEWAQTSFADAHKQKVQENEAWQKMEREARNKRYNERRKRWRKEGEQLQEWWFRQMLETETPYVERMALFWHNHFTTELEVVEDPMLVLEQHKTIREYSWASYGHFCYAIPFDPAMYHYLDSNSNVKGRPNENFAREVMELFTVGEGNYTEMDIKETSRAFTGYKQSMETGYPELRPPLHDSGTKKVLGHNVGPRDEQEDSQEIMKVLLTEEAKPAIFITRKLWRTFISPEQPDDRLIYKHAKVLYYGKYDGRRRGKFNMEQFLRHFFKSEEFWDPRYRGTLIKSPVELLVGVARTTGAKISPEELRKWTTKLGEEVFDPPNVKGWHGYDAWISTETVLERRSILKELAGRIARDGDAYIAEAVKDKDFASLAATFYPIDLPSDAEVPASIEELVLNPLFQLK